MRKPFVVGVTGLSGLFLLVAAGWMWASTTTVMPEDPVEKRAWLEAQAEGFAPKIDRALRSSKVAGGPLAFKAIETYPEQSRVDIVYAGDKDAFSKFANAQHARSWDVMRFANFELRKALCKTFQRTSMKANDVVFVVAFKLGDDPNHNTVFNEDGCRLYV